MSDVLSRGGCCGSFVDEHGLHVNEMDTEPHRRVLELEGPPFGRAAWCAVVAGV